MMKTHYAFVAVLLVLAAMACLASPALAQGEGGSTAGLVVGRAITYIIYALQAMLSITVIALTIFYFLHINAGCIMPLQVVDQMTEMLDRGAYSELMDFCKTTPTHFTNVVAAGLDKATDGGYQAAVSAVDDKVAEEAVHLENRISWLNLIGSISPMLGLLGTVVGMVMAFDVIAGTENPQPSQLAEGIGNALWTTLFGLAIAIPAMSFFFYFRNRLAYIVAELRAVSTEMFGRFRERRGENEGPHTESARTGKHA